MRPMSHVNGWTNAMTSNSPAKAANAPYAALGPRLAPVRAALLVPAPVSRWGVGYVQGGEVLLSRTPRSSADAVDCESGTGGQSMESMHGNCSDRRNVTIAC